MHSASLTRSFRGQDILFVVYAFSMSIGGRASTYCERYILEACRFSDVVVVLQAKSVRTAYVVGPLSEVFLTGICQDKDALVSTTSVA